MKRDTFAATAAWMRFVWAVAAVGGIVETMASLPWSFEARSSMDE
jgi:hypothetical protein